MGSFFQVQSPGTRKIQRNLQEKVVLSLDKTASNASINTNSIYGRDFHRYRRSLQFAQSDLETENFIKSGASPSASLPVAHQLNQAMTSAMDFVVEMTERGVSMLRNLVTSVNSFANAINNRLTTTSSLNSLERGNNSKLVKIIESNQRKNESLKENRTSKSVKTDNSLNKFIGSNQLQFLNGTKQKKEGSKGKKVKVKDYPSLGNDTQGIKDGIVE